MKKKTHEEINEALTHNNVDDLITIFNDIIDILFKTNMNVNYDMQDDIRQDCLILMFNSIHKCKKNKGSFNFFYTIAKHYIPKRIVYYKNTIHTTKKLIRICYTDYAYSAKLY